MTGKMLAAAAGAAAGYAVYRRQQDPSSAYLSPDNNLVASTPLANVAAGALAAVVSRSAVAGFLVGFALSAFGGTRLEEMVGQKIAEAKNGATRQATYPEAA